MKKILIVVDVQVDFRNGVLGTKEADKAIPHIMSIIKEYQANGDRIIYTKDTHDESYLETREGKALPIPHCIYGTQGWEAVYELQDLGCEHNANDIFLKKTFGSAELAQEAMQWSDCEEDVEIKFVGFCTDICVITNVLLVRTFAPEARIVVDVRGCAGVTPEKHQAALEVMRSCQVTLAGEE